MENYKKYDMINDRTLKYKENIRGAALVKDIALRNAMILDWRNQERY